jgi:hypothetical protein
MLFQCALTCAFGFLGFWWALDEPNKAARTLAALVAGFGGMWLTMKLYVWVRYGWKAARSLTMDPG